MKIIWSFSILLFAACNNADKKSVTSISGVYNMLTQRIYNDKTDTTYSTLQQLKIFTEDHVMYANFNPSDSVSSFGIGTYTINKDTYLKICFTAPQTLHLITAPASLP